MIFNYLPKARLSKWIEVGSAQTSSLKRKHSIYVIGCLVFPASSQPLIGGELPCQNPRRRKRRSDRDSAKKLTETASIARFK
jgi:hypothetical protein